jgi:hypothetical protein
LKDLDQRSKSIIDDYSPITKQLEELKLAAQEREIVPVAITEPTQKVVDSLNLYWSALKNRKTTDTGTNETSSRSHLITVISKFALKEDEDEEDVLINSLYFC